MLPVLVLNLASLTVAVPAGSLEFTGHAPTASIQSRTQYGSLLLALSLNCTEATSTNYTVEPGAGALAFTGYIPIAGVNHVVTVPVGSATFTGQQPAANVGFNISVPNGSASLTGYAPSLIRYYVASPGVGSLAFTGYAPTATKTSGCRAYGPLLVFGLNLDPLVGTDYTVNIPSVNGYTFTGYLPTVSKSGDVSVGWDDLVAEPATFDGDGYKNALISQQFVYPGAGSLSFTGYAATVTNSLLTNPLTGALVLIGRQPTVNISYEIPSGSLTLTGLTPDVVTSGPVVTPPAGSLTLTGYVPTSNKNVIGTGYLRAGRGFVFKYEDQYGAGTLAALPAAIDTDVNRGATGDGEFFAGTASIEVWGWDLVSTGDETWTCQDDASDTWTDTSTLDETWTNV